jgi:single stranded DNA-binding protein
MPGAKWRNTQYCLGRQAETAAEYLAKGRQVYIDGRLRLEEYTDREGNLRISPEVNANDIHFLGQRGETLETEEQKVQVDEAAVAEEAPKPAATSRNGKRSTSKRAPAKEPVGIEVRDVDRDSGLTHCRLSGPSSIPHEISRNSKTVPMRMTTQLYYLFLKHYPRSRRLWPTRSIWKYSSKA